MMPRGADAAGRYRRWVAAAWMAALPALVLALPPNASAHSYSFGAIEVGHVWTPPPAPKAEGVAVYGPLLNMGKAADRLVSASSPIAEKTRFRIAKAGKTTWPEAIDLAPGRPLALAPWRVHIWLTGLKHPLKDGDSFDLVLTFAKAGRHTVKVIVEHASGH